MHWSFDVHNFIVFVSRTLSPYLGLHGAYTGPMNFESWTEVLVWVVKPRLEFDYTYFILLSRVGLT